MGVSLPTRYTIGSWSAVNNGPPAVDAAGTWWRVTTETGWSGNDAPSANTVEREQADGGDDGPVWEAGRTITLGGSVMAGDQLSLQAAIDQLTGLLVAGPRLLPLVVAEAHLTRQCVVRRDGPKQVAKISPYLATFTMSLYAADPVRYSAALHTAATGLYSGAAGRVFPLVFPMAFGALGNQGFAAVHNAGDLDAYPLLTLTAPVAPLVNPQIRLVGGSLLRLNLTLAVGDSIVIDTANESVLLNGSVSRFLSLSGDSEFFSCPSGDSQLLFTADSGTGAQLVAAWRDRYS